MGLLTPFSPNLTKFKTPPPRRSEEIFFDLLHYPTLNDDDPSPDAEAGGDLSGDRAPSTRKQKAVKAAHVATQKASVRLRKRSKNSLWANLFGGENQLWNILAMAVAVLLLIVVGILIAAIILGKSEFFLEASRPVLALVATIIAFIIGQRTGPSH